MSAAGLAERREYPSIDPPKIIAARACIEPALACDASGRTPPNSDGPELEPLTPHLSNTPIENLRALFIHCLVQGLKDRDSRWVNDPAFLVVCDYAGLEGDTPEMIRALYNEGRLNFRALELWNQGNSGIV